MPPVLSALRAGIERAAAGAAKLDRRQLAWGGLALAGVTFLSVNLIAATVLRPVRADFTKEGLYTISDGTRKALQSIDEPQGVVNAIFDYYEKRGFQPSEAEEEILLNL